MSEPLGIRRSRVTTDTRPSTCGPYLQARGPARFEIYLDRDQLKIHRINYAFSVCTERQSGGIMHPEIAKALVAQHREELMQHSASRHHVGRRRFPRWRVSWTRAVLVPAVAPGSA